MPQTPLRKVKENFIVAMILSNFAQVFMAILGVKDKSITIMRLKQERLQNKKRVNLTPLAKERVCR